MSGILSTNLFFLPLCNAAYFFVTVFALRPAIIVQEQMPSFYIIWENSRASACWWQYNSSLGLLQSSCRHVN